MTRIATALALLPLLLSGTGCATSGRAQIRLEPAQSRSILTKTFGQVWFAVTPEGDLDFLLVDDTAATQTPRRARARGALQPIELAPVRQALLVRTNWKHRIGTLANPSSANATITWYVLGESGERDLVVYQGIAHVLVTGGTQDRHCTLDIRDATVEPTLVSGQMADPIGLARLTGRFRATREQGQMRDVLADMEARRAAARTGP